MVMGYHVTAATTVGAAATLPFTGFNLLWVALAGFALISAGFAVRRILPKRQS